MAASFAFHIRQQQTTRSLVFATMVPAHSSRARTARYAATAWETHRAQSRRSAARSLLSTSLATRALKSFCGPWVRFGHANDISETRHRSFCSYALPLTTQLAQATNRGDRRLFKMRPLPGASLESTLDRCICPVASPITRHSSRIKPGS